MKKYEVTGRFLRLSTGKIGLTKEQAKPRMYGLKKTKQNGVYEIMKNVEFKRGEIIKIDEKDVNKISCVLITPVENGGTEGQRDRGKEEEKKDSLPGNNDPTADGELSGENGGEED